MNKSDKSIQESIYDEVMPRTMSRADEKKLLIIQAAIQTYASIDIGYVSYEDIARQAGVNRPLVNHHFPDKEVLFTLASKTIRAHFQKLAIEEIQKKDNPKDQLIAYVSACLRWAQESSEHFRAWMFFFYICMANPKQRSLHKELTDMGMHRIEGLLQAAAHAGQTTGPADLAIKAKNIQRVITGAMVEFATEHDHTDSKSLHSIRDQAVELCLTIAGFR
jgi:AcrR family transcriptional regulator